MAVLPAHCDLDHAMQVEERQSAGTLTRLQMGGSTSRSVIFS
ncbi:MAG TPA: hypothetical protein VEU30_01970 [Thermoanaerobaculia bacterium]|nr:hypothetical protein [Thermoanaerobaculia bacterium]